MNQAGSNFPTFFVCESDILSAEDVALVFKQLHEVEHAFRTLKNHFTTPSSVSSQGRTHSGTCRIVLVSLSSRPTNRGEYLHLMPTDCRIQGKGKVCSL